MAMQFVVSKQNLQKELGFVQGVVEKKNTIPVLSNILIESVGETTIRITGTDLDVTIRCEMDAEEITTPGSMCVQARKLLEIARLLPDAPVSFKKEDNEWVTRWSVLRGTHFRKFPRSSRPLRSFLPA
jgi:DNA polymerase-3 subunit beta